MSSSSDNWLEKALKQSSKARHRTLLVLSGERADCWRLLNSLLGTGKFKEIYAFQPIENCSLDCLTAKRASDLLGTDNDCVIFDAWGGFDPDAFGIISGSINGGGLAVLITPRLSDWPQFADPQNQRLAIHPLHGSDISGHYLRRISKILSLHLKTSVKIKNIECRLLVTQNNSPPPARLLPNAEQHELITSIEQLISQQLPRNPIVVTADRGRGKSTALGLAAARLLANNLVANVIVTAPNKSALGSFFSALESGPSTARRELCSFIPADVLVRDLPSASLLIIDEAAAIALPVLLKLINRYPRCVVSSTLHGYEGSGRGFALRLKRLLDKKHRSWQEKQLTRPTRFAPDDPLEKLTADLLLLDADIDDCNISGEISIQQCKLSRLKAADLIENEQQLQELFALLVQAHYQTKPLDLKHLLDGPNLSIMALTHNDTILGVVLLAIEEIADDSALQDAIIHGERRPRGHLLSQLLAYQNLETRYLNLKLARIVRIAVRPALQSQSFGSLILEKLFRYCNSERIDGIGASFGATNQLMSFWQRNHYEIVHLGHRRNVSSAAYSAVVFQGITATAKSLAEKARDNFVCCLRFRKDNNKLPPSDEINLNTLLALSSIPDKTFVKAVVSSYACRHRNFESSHSQLFHYLHNKDLAHSGISQLQHKLLSSVILRCESWGSAAKEARLQGRKDCENQLREALRNLLANR